MTGLEPEAIDESTEASKRPVTLVFNNPLQWGIIAASGGLCSLLLLSGLVRDPASVNPINGTLIVALIGLTWLGYVRFKDRAPQVQMDDTGIRLRALDNLLLPWPDIAGVRLVPRGLLGIGGGQRLSEIQIAVRDYRGLCSKLNAVDRIRLFFKGLRFVRIAVNLRTMIYDKAALEFVIRTYLPNRPASKA